MKLTFPIETYLLAAVSGVIATAVSWWWGAWLDVYLESFGFHPLGWKVIPLVATGWMVQFALAGRWLKHGLKEYYELLCKMMIAGVALLIPSTLLAYFMMADFPVFITGPIISSAVMLAMHHTTIKRLGLPRKLTVSWFLALQITAGAWLLTIF